MSDTENTNATEPVEIVTTKDPKRVEQSKRLAAISREAKERKMRQKIEEELKYKNNNIDLTNYLVPAVATLGVFTFFYYWNQRNIPQQQQQQVVEQPPQREQSQPPKKFESFVE